MTLYLKQATARNIGVGQLLSSTDGLTAFTTAVATTDIHLWKGTATTLAHAEAATVNISNGIHYLALGTTDTDTVGSMIIFIQPTGCLPLRMECCVLAANVYDSLIGGGGVDLLDVSTVQWTGTAVHGTTTAGVPIVDIHEATSVTIGTVTTCTTTTTNTDVTALAAEVAKIPKSDAAVTWNATALASINAEVDTALNTAIPASNTANSVNDILLDVSTNAAVADAVWDEVLTSGHAGAGSSAVILSDVLVDTGTTLDALIKKVLGLSQENFRISSPVFSSGKMTSCTVKIYPTATDCTNDTNVIATYNITATYDGNGDLATYKSLLV